MSFQDRQLECADCGQPFNWTAGEQQFYKDRGFKNEPRRCNNCKAAKMESIGAKTPYEKQETVVNCAECGTETTVPFAPKKGKPVLCRKCFQKAKQAGKANGVQTERRVGDGKTELSALLQVLQEMVNDPTLSDSAFRQELREQLRQTSGK